MNQRESRALTKRRFDARVLSASVLFVSALVLVAHAEEAPVVDPVDSSASSSKEDATKQMLDSYQNKAQPLLEQYCYGCHGADTQEAGFQIDDLNPNMIDGSDAEHWDFALDMINQGDMPPDYDAQPTDEERRVMVEWMTSSIELSRKFSKPVVNANLRRLTREQYAYTLGELLHLPIAFEQDLPNEAKSKMGFTNSGEALVTSPLHVEYFQSIARKALDKAIVTGERPESHHYRVTLGTDVGKGHHAAVIGGYQSAPIPREHVRAEILDDQGHPRSGTTEEETAALRTIESDIGIGMRGSDGNRYRVVDDGLLLYSALPHTELPPKSWQGPSPNMKLLLRKCYPSEGPIIARVVASLAAIEEESAEAETAEGETAEPTTEEPRTAAIRAFVGNRTDDGMEYTELTEPHVVSAEPGQPATYEFRGYLENLPIPVIDLNDTGDLANIMILGIWNDHLVKSNSESGVPIVVRSIEFEAPYYEVWPPASHTGIFFDSPLKETDVDAYTREVLNRFISKAFRRDLTDVELDRYFEFWQAIRGDYDNYHQGVKEVLIAALCSPHFLYLDTPLDQVAADVSLAEKLAYFLWNSPPDEELYQLAEQGTLRENLGLQVERMIADKRFERFIDSFTTEWLRLDRHSGMNVNIGAYRDYTRFVKRDMALETKYFVQHVIENNLSLLTFVDSDFAMLNQNLAEFYGIEGVTGGEFRPVSITPDMHRGGLLSQGAFLCGHSDGTQAHPIKRAVWLKDKILGTPPPPPPPNVPQLDPETPGFQNLTLKEQLELHRNKPSCVDCHRKIDPYGVAFENYDAVGRYQLKAKGRPIDSRSELPDGTVVNGIDELKTYLLEKQPDAVTKSVVDHLMAYALGRDTNYADEPQIDAIVDRVVADEYRVQTAIRAIVESPAFLGVETSIVSNSGE
ncbi:DUF1592 domain-containing protein [Aeoliella mucimassa]|uniref:Planctomycete cytochrome C n=1 Tax=Aeoliella mucimassa TaxID=2527972 RepID=A0A518AK31_9BACT|nr:DUF1592 domain-containing protein [Aeoliella mucimassa]QDU55091.1 hypothetical protein Pan181_12770 [Aeoliella mucimassa]